MPILKRYLYKVEMSYIEANGKEHTIVPNSIQYIMTSYDYDNAFMPIIAVKVKLASEIHSLMTNSQGSGKVYLNILKYCDNGTSVILTSYIRDQFDYIMNNNPNQTSVFDNMVAGQGQAYKVCMIGLTKKELIAQNQKSFNGVIRNTNMATLIMNGFTDIDKVVMEPLVNNTLIGMLDIPQSKSVTQYLAYLNKKYNFYNGAYMFFMDFNKTYLKSLSGKYIDARDGQYPYVAFDIRDTTNTVVDGSGMVVDDRQLAYIIYVDPADAQAYRDNITAQTSANIVTVESTGEQHTSTTIDTSEILNVQPNLDSTTYINSNDPNASQYIANTLKNNAITIVLSKTDLDVSVFTPNKEYMISHYRFNPRYTGRYYLSFKKELFYNADADHFSCAANIGLTMVIHY